MSALASHAPTHAASGAQRRGAAAFIIFPASARRILDYGGAASLLDFYLLRPDPWARKENWRGFGAPPTGPGGSVAKLQAGCRRRRLIATAKSLKRQDNCVRLQSCSAKASRVTCAQACADARVRAASSITLQLYNFRENIVLHQGHAGCNAGCKVAAGHILGGGYAFALSAMRDQTLFARPRPQKFWGIAALGRPDRARRDLVAIDVEQLAENGGFLPFSGARSARVGRAALEGRGQVPAIAAKSAPRRKPVRLAGGAPAGDRRRGGVAPPAPRATSTITLAREAGRIWNALSRVSVMSIGEKRAEPQIAQTGSGARAPRCGKSLAGSEKAQIEEQRKRVGDGMRSGSAEQLGRSIKLDDGGAHVKP